jgi:peptidoglycan/LPS O-acetylase OafA/YrhL
MNRPTSLYLDLVRPVAALVVMLSHVSQTALTGGQMKLFAYTGTEAVDVFFVLSGFVIAHVYATREGDWRGYAISRATRIYSVAMPALLLTAAVDAIGLAHDRSVYEVGYQPFTPGLVLRSAFFIGEQWNSHRFPGSDGPYWSLGFEVWYYAAFGVFMYAPRGWRWLGAAATLVFIGPKVAVLFPIWLFGVLSYRLCADGRVRPRLGWLLLAAPIVAFAVYQTFSGQHQQQFSNLSWTADRIEAVGRDYVIAALFAVHIVGVAAVSKTFAPWLERKAGAIRWLAGATFSIYLVHLPIMHVVAALSPWPKASPLTLWLILGATPLLCLVFAELFERRKATWRNGFSLALQAAETPLAALRRGG